MADQLFVVTVAYRDDFDVALALAVAAKLGLTNETLIKMFSLEFGDIIASLLSDIRKHPGYLLEKSKLARLAGQAVVEFYVAMGLIKQVETFLGKAADAAQKRVAVAGHQVLEGDNNAMKGAYKDLAEGADDMNQGAGKALKGAYDFMTNPVGSENFKDGFSGVLHGTGRFKRGLDKFFFMTPLDYGLTRGLKNISGFQTMSFMESLGRTLNSVEISELQKVFGSSVEYGIIRVKTGYAGVLSMGRGSGGLSLTQNERAITIGNTIYMKSTPPNNWMSVLVHETTHVWQNQNGGTDYMIEAFWAQEIAGAGYDYKNEVLAQNPKPWSMLNPEQQGQLIQDSYTSGFLVNGQPTGKWIEPQIGGGTRHRTDIEQYFIKQNVLGQLRSGQGAT
jgi:hypothetical protein